MFDSPHFPRVFERLLDSEQAAAIIRVHPKTLQRYARHGIVVGLRVGKLWRFRASDLIPLHLENHGEEEDLDEDAQAQYAGLNHSCPQPDRR
jgi:phage terminase Nu1 subunit (DNA packaging protein)